MKRYESYKDSGVKWLGEIPGHWEVKRFRFLFSENKTKNTKLKEKKQLQFRYGEIVPKERQDIDEESSKIISKYTIVKERDIIINGLNLNYDFISQRVAMVRESGIITSAYISLRSKIELITCFYNYFMKAMDSRMLFHGMGSGIRLTLSYDNLKNLFFPYPDIAEQTAIANYLDSVTSKIDEAISQQQKMIDLLNERKQIIIQNAVTKGLDPNAKMKDSGVEWIGEIPENWEVRRLNSIGRFSKGGNISRDQLTEDGKCEAILYGDIYTKYYIKASIIRNHITEKTAMNSVRIKSGDILMTGSGETKEDIGKTIMFDSQIAYIGGDVILFRQNKMDSLFLSYALNSMYAKVYRYKESKGEIVVHIYSNALKSMKIAAPPMNEQSSIVKYLNRHFLQIDESITSCNKMISLLQERKQIIINDVVTGKVKVI